MPTRRALLVSALTLPVLAACGSSATDEDVAGPVPSSPGVFPVTVPHAYGSTTVPSPPARVVTAGYTEHDTVLALGTKPVAVTDWYGDQPYATWPWARPALASAQPTVLSAADGFQFEKIAAARPDLILATNAGISKGDYEKLSAIAPTVAHSGRYTKYFEPWDVQAVSAGTALGRRQQITAQVSAVKNRFAAEAAAHPEFAGKKAVFLQNAIYDGSAIAYQNGLSTDFLTDLGFTIPTSLDRYAQGGGQAYIPLERLSVLDDADVLIWGTEKPADRTELEKNPIYQRLAAVRENRLVFTDGLTAGAIYFTTVLSLPYVLDKLVPALASGVSGTVGQT